MSNGNLHGPLGQQFCPWPISPKLLWFTPTSSGSDTAMLCALIIIRKNLPDGISITFFKGSLCCSHPLLTSAHCPSSYTTWLPTPLLSPWSLQEYLNPLYISVILQLFKGHNQLGLVITHAWPEQLTKRYKTGIISFLSGKCQKGGLN